MKALVTRPREQATALVAALAARGIEPVVEPLVTIRHEADGARILAPLLPEAQALLFTSANGVAAFAAASTSRALPVFAVGEATAAAARGAGFAEVASAGGNVADLGHLVATRLRGENGTLVHAAAQDVAGDLGGSLAAQGFAVRRAVLYAAVPATAFSVETAALVKAGEIAIALFFSPRTASAFVRLARNAGLLDACRLMAAVALSPAVADELGAGWRALHAASAPTQAALLRAVDRAVDEQAKAES